MAPPAATSPEQNTPKVEEVAAHPFYLLVAAAQRELRQKISDYAGAIRDNPRGTAILQFLGLAFVFGVIHALGPGHGKAFVCSWFLSRRRPDSSVQYQPRNSMGGSVGHAGPGPGDGFHQLTGRSCHHRFTQDLVAPDLFFPTQLADHLQPAGSLRLFHRSVCGYSLIARQPAGFDLRIGFDTAAGECCSFQRKSGQESSPQGPDSGKLMDLIISHSGNFYSRRRVSSVFQIVCFVFPVAFFA